MITAVDTNILLDVLIPDAPHGDQSEAALTEALQRGSLLIGDTVYAELSSYFPDRAPLDHFLHVTGIRLQRTGDDALHAAGRAWREYVRLRPAALVCPACGGTQEVTCTSCGRSLHPRQHVLADFLIGAHARFHADRLLTRDRGFYRAYFTQVQLVPL